MLYPSGRRQRDLLLLAGLGLAALLSYLLLAQVREQSRSEPYAKGRVDYQVEDFELTELDAAGHMVLRLTGEHWEHDQWQQQANFRDVTMQAYEQGDWLWQAEASDGNVNDAGTEVELFGEVEFRYRDEFDSVLNTTALTVYPQSRRFHTDQPVTVVRGQSRITGTGMRGDLTTGEAEIENMQSRVIPDANRDGDR